jgi:hypothetical protein
MYMNSIDFAREYTQRNGKRRYPRVRTRAKSTILPADSGTPFVEAKSIAMCGNHLRQNAHETTCAKFGLAPVLVSIDRVRLQIFQVAKRKTRFMRRRQNDLGRVPRIERFLPPWCTQAPLVARLQARKSKLEVGSREIVSSGLGECQEFGRQNNADRVRPDVFRARIAAAVAEKAGHRRRAARCQLAAKHVFGLRNPNDAVGRGNTYHDGPVLSRWGGPRNHRPGAGFGTMSDELFQALARGQLGRHCSDLRGQWR